MKSNIDKKFSAHYDAVEAELKSSTVGKGPRCLGGAPHPCSARSPQTQGENPGFSNRPYRVY